MRVHHVSAERAKQRLRDNEVGLTAATGSVSPLLWPHTTKLIVIEAALNNAV